MRDAKENREKNGRLKSWGREALTTVQHLYQTEIHRHYFYGYFPLWDVTPWNYGSCIHQNKHSVQSLKAYLIAGGISYSTFNRRFQLLQKRLVWQDDLTYKIQRLSRRAWNKTQAQPLHVGMKQQVSWWNEECAGNYQSLFCRSPLGTLCPVSFGIL